jgi:hypothetical protein
MEEVWGQYSFFNFSLALEKGPHNVIPNGIGGDFFTFEAPNGESLLLSTISMDLIYPQIPYSSSITHNWIAYGGFGKKKKRIEWRRMMGQAGHIPIFLHPLMIVCQ